MGAKQEIDRGRATRTVHWLSVQNLQETTTTFNSSPNVKHASNVDSASNSSATWQDSLLYHTHVPNVRFATWWPVRTTLKQQHWNCTDCIIWSFMHNNQTKSATMIWTNHKTFVLRGCFFVCFFKSRIRSLKWYRDTTSHCMWTTPPNIGHEVGKGSNYENKATLRNKRKK